MNMDYYEIKIYTTTYGIEIVSGVLSNIGINTFAIQDANDFNNFLENDGKYWDYIDEKVMELKNCESMITIYLPQNIQGAEQIISVKNEIERLKNSREFYDDLGRLEIENSSVKQEDWANNWKEYFKPLKIGEKIIIKPSWVDIENNENRKVLEIDPGMSFGTGMHNTTQLCIGFLEEIIKGGEDVLDMGCGSGILSIAALLLGAAHSTGVDVDLAASEVAVKNNRQNNFNEDKFIAYCGDIISDRNFAEKINKEYDVICANIVSDVIKAMSSDFYRYLKPGGYIICSGIISERADEVIESLTNAGLKLSEVREKEDWTALLLKK